MSGVYHGTARATEWIRSVRDLGSAALSAAANLRDHGRQPGEIPARARHLAQGPRERSVVGARRPREAHRVRARAVRHARPRGPGDRQDDRARLLGLLRPPRGGAGVLLRAGPARAAHPEAVRAEAW